VSFGRETALFGTQSIARAKGTNIQVLEVDWETEANTPQRKSIRCRRSEPPSDFEVSFELGRFSNGPIDGKSRSAFKVTEPKSPDCREVEVLAGRLRKPKAQDESCDCLLTDPETGVASGKTKAAICVQDVDVQCVLQFTLIHAAGCALHRHTSRVIHRLELYFRPRTKVSIAERPGNG
jgi:hypothetical protein